MDEGEASIQKSVRPAGALVGGRGRRHDRVDGVDAVLPSIDAVVAMRSSAAPAARGGRALSALRAVRDPGGPETLRGGSCRMLVTQTSAALSNNTGQCLSARSKKHLCAGFASFQRDSLSHSTEGVHPQYLNLRLRRHGPALVEHGRARLHLRAPRVRVGLGRLLLLFFQILHRFRTGRLLGLALRGR